MSRGGGRVGSLSSEVLCPVGWGQVVLYSEVPCLEAGVELGRGVSLYSEISCPEGVGARGISYSEVQCPEVGLGSLYAEVQCIMGNGMDRMTD